VSVDELKRLDQNVPLYLVPYNDWKRRGCYAAFCSQHIPSTEDGWGRELPSLKHSSLVCVVCEQIIQEERAEMRGEVAHRALTRENTDRC
jgi:hypothetical protein